MTPDYRRAVEVLERRAMVLVDRSNPEQWQITPTVLGERMARNIIKRDPAAARTFQALGFALRTGAID